MNWKWKGGAPMSNTSMLLFCAFIPICILCILLSFVPVFKNIWIVPGLFVLLPLFISGMIDQKRHLKSLRIGYQPPAPKNSEAFADEPADIDPENIGDNQLFSLYDRSTADHIGDISGNDLRFLIDSFQKWGHKRNDFFIMPETVMVLRVEGLTESVADLLDAALDKHEDAIDVRWKEKAGNTQS
jgi:hypothetical protein